MNNTPRTNENTRLNAYHMAVSKRNETDTDADIIASADKIEEYLLHGSPSKRRAKLDKREQDINEQWDELLKFVGTEAREQAEASMRLDARDAELIRREATLDERERKLNVREFITGHTSTTSGSVAGVRTSLHAASGECLHPDVRVELDIAERVMVADRITGVKAVTCVHCRQSLHII